MTEAQMPGDDRLQLNVELKDKSVKDWLLTAEISLNQLHSAVGMKFGLGDIVRAALIFAQSHSGKFLEFCIDEKMEEEGLGRPKK